MTWIVLLLGLGLLLILAEVLIPSGGVLGFGASLCIVGAIVWAFVDPQVRGLPVLLAALVLSPVTLILALKLLPYSPLTRKMIAPGFSFEDGSGVDPRDRELLGREGVTETPLRPGGIARFGARRVDVVSRGEAIEKGARVRVLDVLGNRVQVARVEEPATEESAR